MRLTVVGASAIAVSVAALLYALAKSNYVVASASIAIISLVVYDYYFAKSLSSECVEVKRILSTAYAKELENVEVTIEVVNRRRRYLPLVEIEDLLPPMLEAVSRNRFTIALPSGYVARVRYWMRAKVPGEHCLESIAVCLYSPLMMFVNCFEVKNRSYLVATPLAPKLEVCARTFSRLAGLVRGLSMQGLYDLESFREYSYGDDVRKIVWKVLARDRRLVVRVDRGESTARVAAIVLLRKYAWVVGTEPNTLAQRVLRAFQAAIEALSMPGVEIDAFFLTSSVPRLVKSVRKGDARLASSYSWVSYLSGFARPISELLNLCSSLGVDLSSYDYVILVTDLYTLAYEIESVVSVLARTRRGIVLAAIDESLDVDHVALAAACSRELDVVNYELSVASRELEVMIE